MKSMTIGKRRQSIDEKQEKRNDSYIENKTRNYLKNIMKTITLTFFRMLDSENQYVIIHVISMAE